VDEVTSSLAAHVDRPQVDYWTNASP